MYDNFHAQFIRTNLKIQKSNMHGKLKELFPYIFTEENYRTSKSLEFTSMKSVNDMNQQLVGESYASLQTFWEQFQSMQKSSKVLKNLQMDSNISLYAPIYHFG